jgi:hypothetical protein
VRCTPSGSGVGFYYADSACTTSWQLFTSSVSREPAPCTRA